MLNLAARHKEGLWLMAYLGSKSSFAIVMNKVATRSNLKAVWIDPRTGDSVSGGSFPNRGDQSFSTPAGWEDALLILEPES